MIEGYLPNSIAWLMKYFDHLYPNNKWEYCKPVIKVEYDGSEEALREESEYKIKKNIIIIWKNQPNTELGISNSTDGYDISYWK